MSNDQTLMGPKDRICLMCQKRFTVENQFLLGRYCCVPCYRTHQKIVAETLAKEKDASLSEEREIRYLARGLITNAEITDIDSAVEALACRERDNEIAELRERVEALEEAISEFLTTVTGDEY